MPQMIDSVLVTLVGVAVVLAAGCSRQPPKSHQASKADKNSESRQPAAAWRGKEEYERAIASYSRSIRHDAANPIPYNNRGLLRVMKGEYEKAIADYNEAIRLDPTYFDARYNRGCCQYDKGDVDKAIEDFTEAIQINPKQADPYSARGNAWFHRGAFDKAITDFDDAIRLYPNDSRDYYYRGSAWQNKGELNKAIADFTAAITLNPKYADAYKRRGLAWYRKREYDKAIADYTASVRLDPDDHMVYFRRGRAWSRKHEFDKAIVDYDDAIRLNPNEAIANDCLAWLLATCSSAEFRDGTRAVKLATTACELTGWVNALPINTLAAAYAESGNFEEAVRRQQQAIDLLDKDANKSAFEERMEHYNNRKPYRQTPRSRPPEERYLTDA